ncbi:chaperonin 10-like protein [Macrophomina phaseolina]|uniref:Chaperonin 10-like protein n=1 Tax=Macrophomina phaseolina TaxID=35725 RepID=A0ABQ8GJH0_9PEZI|nr:chaperonin 10-like protein [Macrophomina phaseolina]
MPDSAAPIGAGVRMEQGPDELLIRINATGICYSDIHLMSGDLGFKMSETGCLVAGHEAAGVGANVKNWKVVDRAGVKPMRGTCGQCELCFEGKDNYRRAARASGLTDPGTFQQYITAPARYTNRIPDGVSDYVAGPLMCGGLTAYGSLKRACLKAGNWLVTSSRRHGGAEKKALALARGAEHFVDFATAGDISEARGLSALPQSVQDLKEGRVTGHIVIDLNRP